MYGVLKPIWMLRNIDQKSRLDKTVKTPPPKNLRKRYPNHRNIKITRKKKLLQILHCSNQLNTDSIHIRMMIT
jgi:hypothetical protein